MNERVLKIATSLQESVTAIGAVVVVDPEKPWLDRRGKPIADAQLKIVSKTWSPETWERYLTWFEKPRRESLIDNRAYDRACDSAQSSIFDFAQCAADDELRARVVKYLGQLTERQRQVIRMTFWEGRSERFIADQLEISQVSVHNLKHRAIKKFGDLLKGGYRLPYYGGGRFSDAIKTIFGTLVNSISDEEIKRNCALRREIKRIRHQFPSDQTLNRKI